MIRFDKVNKWYGPQLKVLNEVTAEVKKGEVVVVCGPSGSGKTTLIRTINRLEPIDSGSITVNGKDSHSSKNNVNTLRRDIGFVFQQFNLFPHMSVLDNVALAPRKLRGLGAEQARALARRELGKVGLQAKAEVRPATLSGGQQQRVAIARALAMKPQIMFFDEATSALDPELVKGVLALMTELSQEGMTMVVVTHEMGYARGVSDSVLFMDHGRVVETGPPAQLFEAPATERLQNFLAEVL